LGRLFVLAAFVVGAAFIFLFIMVLTRLMKSKKKTGGARRPLDFGPPPAAINTPLKTKKVLSTSTKEPFKMPAFIRLGADIVVEKGTNKDQDKKFPLHQPVTSIGRPGTRKNDIELNDETVSKEQASIYYDKLKKEFSVANESATNPTRVNGRPISSPIILENGALLEIGLTVLRFKKD